LFRLSLISLALLMSTVTKATNAEIFGKWHCKQSYEAEGDMFFESKYEVFFEENSLFIEQNGYISLTSQIDSTKVSKLEYQIDGKRVINGNHFEFTATQITANVIENSLGIINESFLQQFTENRETYKGTFEIIDGKTMTSIYENGEVISCEKEGL
jgi:hypothetical protein